MFHLFFFLLLVFKFFFVVFLLLAVVLLQLVPQEHAVGMPPSIFNSNSTVIYHLLFYFREARKDHCVPGTQLVPCQVSIFLCAQFRRGLKKSPKYPAYHVVVTSHKVTTVINNLLLTVVLCFHKVRFPFMTKTNF